MYNGGFELLLVFIVLIPILFLAYITTRFVAGKSNKALKGRYINIIETVSLGVDKKLHLVKVDNQFILIASSGKSIEFLTSVRLDEFQDNENPAVEHAFDFKSLFEKYISAYKNKRDGKAEVKESIEDPAKEAEGVHFKSNLYRLRTITGRMDKKAEENGVDNTNDK